MDEECRWLKLIIRQKTEKCRLSFESDLYNFEILLEVDHPNPKSIISKVVFLSERSELRKGIALRPPYFFLDTANAKYLPDLAPIQIEVDFGKNVKPNMLVYYHKLYLPNSNSFCDIEKVERAFITISQVNSNNFFDSRPGFTPLLPTSPTHTNYDARPPVPPNGRRTPSSRIQTRVRVRGPERPTRRSTSFRANPSTSKIIGKYRCKNNRSSTLPKKNYWKKQKDYTERTMEDTRSCMNEKQAQAAATNRISKPTVCNKTKKRLPGVQHKTGPNVPDNNTQEEMDGASEGVRLQVEIKTEIEINRDHMTGQSPDAPQVVGVVINPPPNIIQTQTTISHPRSQKVPHRSSVKLEISTDTQCESSNNNTNRDLQQDSIIPEKSLNSESLENPDSLQQSCCIDDCHDGTNKNVVQSPIVYKDNALTFPQTEEVQEKTETHCLIPPDEISFDSQQELLKNKLFLPRPPPSSCLSNITTPIPIFSNATTAAVTEGNIDVNCENVRPEVPLPCTSSRYRKIPPPAPRSMISDAMSPEAPCVGRNFDTMSNVTLKTFTSIATSCNAPALSAYPPEEEHYRKEVLLNEKVGTPLLELSYRLSKCGDCNIPFTSVAEGFLHYRREHQLKRCPKCFLCFSSIGTVFKEHLSAHFVLEHIQCAYCEEIMDHEDLWEHVEKKHLLRPLQIHMQDAVEEISQQNEVPEESCAYTVPPSSLSRPPTFLVPSTIDAESVNESVISSFISSVDPDHSSDSDYVPSEDENSETGTSTADSIVTPRRTRFTAENLNQNPPRPRPPTFLVPSTIDAMSVVSSVDPDHPSDSDYLPSEDESTGTSTVDSLVTPRRTRFNGEKMNPNPPRPPIFLVPSAIDAVSVDGSVVSSVDPDHPSDSDYLPSEDESTGTSTVDSFVTAQHFRRRLTEKIGSPEKTKALSTRKTRDSSIKDTNNRKREQSETSKQNEPSRILSTSEDEEHETPSTSTGRKSSDIPDASYSTNVLSKDQSDKGRMKQKNKAYSSHKNVPTPKKKNVCLPSFKNYSIPKKTHQRNSKTFSTNTNIPPRSPVCRSAPDINLAPTYSKNSISKGNNLRRVFPKINKTGEEFSHTKSFSSVTREDQRQIKLRQVEKRLKRQKLLKAKTSNLSKTNLSNQRLENFYNAVPQLKFLLKQPSVPVKDNLPMEQQTTTPEKLIVLTKSQESQSCPEILSKNIGNNHKPENSPPTQPSPQEERTGQPRQFQYRTSAQMSSTGRPHQQPEQQRLNASDSNWERESANFPPGYSPYLRP